MYLSFGTGFRIGLAVAAIIALTLLYLWQPERQVRLHNQHLLDAVAAKNWSKLASFVDNSYQDQWGNDRPLLLARLREILTYAHNLRIDQIGVAVALPPNEPTCTARIKIEADENELTAMMKERVNSLETPFIGGTCRLSHGIGN